MLVIDLIFQFNNGKKIEKLKSKLELNKDLKLLFSKEKIDTNNHLFPIFNKAKNDVSRQLVNRNDYEKNTDELQKIIDTRNNLSEELVKKSLFLDKDMSDLYSEFLKNYRLIQVNYSNWIEAMYWFSHNSKMIHVDTSTSYQHELGKWAEKVEECISKHSEYINKLDAILEKIKKDFHDESVQNDIIQPNNTKL